MQEVKSKEGLGGKEINAAITMIALIVSYEVLSTFAYEYTQQTYGYICTLNRDISYENKSRILVYAVHIVHL